MQGTREILPFDEPFTVRQDTDTATPRGQIPIYLMHGGSQPFCDNRTCFCQRGKQAGALLFSDIAAGKLQVVQLIAGVPKDCYYYGHSWEITEHPDIKECSVCSVHGYCPLCTPVPPAGALPFPCTAHSAWNGERKEL